MSERMAFLFQLEVRNENQSNRAQGRIELNIIHYFKNIISLTFKVIYCIHMQSWGKKERMAKAALKMRDLSA